MAAVGTAQWSSRFAFIMAAVGSSVGLGNLWRFSAEAGKNGGGAFIMIYLAFIIFVGLPVLMSEFIIGRAGQASSAIKSVDDLSNRSNASKAWNISAWFGMIASFLIVSFYCMVAAWVIAYIPKFLTGAFTGKTAADISMMFEGTIDTVTGVEGCRKGIGDCVETAAGLSNSPNQVLPWFIGFAIMTTFLVSRGVNKGIEVAAKYLMPLFFVLLVGLSIYAITTSGDGTKKAMTYMFTPDFSKVTWGVAVAALGQACFSLGIGNAIMITYGSYLPRDVSIPKSAFVITATDTLVALTAGMAIFPIMFAHNLTGFGGEGLFFQALPVAIANVPGGMWIGAGFFFLAFFAAITSSVSLLEPTVAWVAERFNMKKAKAAWIMGFFMVLLGLGSVYSDWFFGLINNKLVGPILAPLSALLVVLFTGWRLDKKIVQEQLAGDGEALGNFIMIFVKWVAPIFMGVVLALSIYDAYLKNLFV